MKNYLKVITFAAFALAVATSAQAMSPVPLHQSDGVITQVREACGAGRYELMVSAWPEPPSAMSAGRRAGVRDGVEALAFGITETRTTSTADRR